MNLTTLRAMAAGLGLVGSLNLNSEFSRYPYNFGQTKWARDQRKKVVAMRREVRDDAGRKAAAAAKRERRMLRNRMGWGTGRWIEYTAGIGV
jgi:hypothetical protein